MLLINNTIFPSGKGAIVEEAFLKSVLSTEIRFLSFRMHSYGVLETNFCLRGYNMNSGMGLYIRAWV